MFDDATHDNAVEEISEAADGGPTPPASSDSEGELTAADLAELDALVDDLAQFVAQLHLDGRLPPKSEGDVAVRNEEDHRG